LRNDDGSWFDRYGQWHWDGSITLGWGLRCTIAFGWSLWGSIRFNIGGRNTIGVDFIGYRCSIRIVSGGSIPTARGLWGTIRVKRVSRFCNIAFHCQ
jgi:hypothetical protein